MLPQELNLVCKEAFIELIFQTTKFHGRTYCYFNPFRGRNPSYHITVAEQSTGYAAVIPLTVKSAMILDKAAMKELYGKILNGILLAVEKHKDQAKPVDYKKFPLKAEGRESKLQNIETNEKVTVEIYSWSKLIV